MYNMYKMSVRSGDFYVSIININNEKVSSKKYYNKRN